jgi:hypothetical protein
MNARGSRRKNVVLVACTSIAFLFPAASRAADEPTKGKQTVIAEGIGADAENALKDAFRAAIRQVVGAMVDSETLVKDDQVISDKVLIYSDGIIKGGYKELSRQEENGIVRIRISASVERRSVALKLREAHVTVKEVEGKDLAAEVFTQKEARENAAELVQKAFAELPKLFKAEPGKVNADSYDEETGILKVAVAVGTDAGKYSAFQKKLVALLDKVSRDKNTAITDFKPTFPKVPVRDEKNWVLWVSTGIDAQAMRGRWKVYLMDCDLSTCFSDVNGAYCVHVSLLDAEGQVVTEEEMPIMKWSLRKENVVQEGISPLGKTKKEGRLFQEITFQAGISSLVHSTYNDADNLAGTVKYNVLGIAPLYFDSSDACRTSCVYGINVKLTVADLARMKEIKCKIVFRPSKTEDKEP